MNKVKIQIGPRHYSIACDPADEEKVRKFGAVIDENYAKLGGARAPQEADNMVFAALFMADELDEARKAVSDAKAELAEMRGELQRLKDDTANQVHTAKAEAEQEKEKASKSKAELRAEIETLRKAEEHSPQGQRQTEGRSRRSPRESAPPARPFWQPRGPRGPF